ncbi:MAG: SufE family protein [Proteobacteria bacterium]|nr:SufE family protein [Pseudomonadota bacterium]
MGKQTIQSTCDELVQSFKKTAEKQALYQQIFTLGKEFQGLEDHQKDAKFLVKNCLSQAWLIPSYKEDKVYFAMDSDALIVKGVMSLLHRVYHDRTPEEILSVDVDFWLNLGLVHLLSMNRRNGTLGLIKQIRLYGVTYQAIHKTNQPPHPQPLT